MPRHTLYFTGPLILVPALLLGVAALSTAPLSGQEAPPAAPQQEPQVLTRGPIHEGFAEPVSFNPKPGLIAPKEPPPPVEEIPPEDKPAGENVAWLGGYWSWDDDRKDYIWVSGFWRVLPPGRKWMPGYWNQADTGHQWVAGYWANVQQPEVEYLPPPPDTLEQGPVTEAPSTDHLWVPGCWVYRSRYLWRPGYWIVSQPGWSWNPSHYVYAPTGYVYVDGYWDYAFARRGVLFAPCYFDPWRYHRRAYVYRPSICLDMGLVTTHFFARPAYNHYYFGDYYASSYVSLGFSPWFSFHYSRGHYCPAYAYNRWHHRHTPGWEAGLRVDFGYRRDHIAARPPRTYIQQQNIVNNTTIINNNKTVINNIDARYRNQLALAQPISVAARKARENKDSPLRFERVAPQQANHFRQQARINQEARQERQKMERETINRFPRGQGGSGAPAQPIRLTPPKAGIAAKPLPDTTGGANVRPGGGGRPGGEGGAGGAANRLPGGGRPGGGNEANPGGNRPPVIRPGGGNEANPGGGVRPPMGRPGGGEAKPPVTQPGPGAGNRLPGREAKPPVVPPSGGNRPPVVAPPGGGQARPPVAPPSGGQAQPPAVPPRNQPPVVPPTDRKPMIPPSGGNRLPIGPHGGGEARPPVLPPSGGGRPQVPPSGGYIPPSGGNRPPAVPPQGGGRPQQPPSGGGRNFVPPQGGGRPPQPPQGGGRPQQPPSGGGRNFVPPSGGGRQSPPPSGGGRNFTPPQGGGRQQPPPPPRGGNPGNKGGNPTKGKR